MQNTGYTELIMNQGDNVLLGTEADKVDISFLGIYIMKLQLVAKASPVFHKDTTIWNSIRFILGDYLRPLIS